MPKMATFAFQRSGTPIIQSMEIGAEWIGPGLWGLFLASFLAATILPFSSEALLAAMALGPWSTVDLLLVASMGNTMGGMTSYGIGRLGDPDRIARWLRTDPEKAVRWQELTARNGVWAALLTWLPVIGDPIAIALGLVRAGVWQVLILMFLGKAMRYAVVLMLLR